MGKTLDVARDRAFDQKNTVLPAEVARGVYIEHPPSAQALKLIHLLIGVVAEVPLGRLVPLSPAASGHAFDLGGAEFVEAVHECDADVDFGGLAVGVS